MAPRTRRWEATLAIGLVVAGLIVPAVASVPAGASAPKPKPRVYEGTLGTPDSMIEFQLRKRVRGPLVLRGFAFVTDVPCEDGTIQLWGIGYGFAGPPDALPELPSHRLDFDAVDPSTAIHLHGMIQAVHGEGTLAWTTSALAADETAVLCTTGERTWTVERTEPAVTTSSPTGQPIEVHRYRFGDVTVTLARYA